MRNLGSRALAARAHQQRQNYIPTIPAGLCKFPWAYKFSPATNNAGMPSLTIVILLSL